MFAPNTTNTVHCVATDCCGNTNSCDFMVTVVRCATTLEIKPASNGIEQQFIQLNWPTNAGSPFWWLQSATSFDVGTVWETHLWATNPPIIWPMTNQERYFRLFQTN